MNIRSKITTGMMVAALLPLLMYWAISYSEARARVGAEVKTQLTSIVQRQAAHVDDWMDATLRGMKLAASSPALADLDAAAARSATQRLVANYPWLVASFVAGADGQQIARNNNEPLSNIGERSYFRSALASEVTTQVAISKANHQPVLLSAAPILDRAGVRPVGVLGISAELTTVADMVLAEKAGASGFSFLLNADGKLVAHPDKAKIEAATSDAGGEDFMKHPAVGALQAAARTSYVAFEKDGTAWVSAAAKTKSGWIMVTQMAQSEAQAPLKALNLQAALTLIGAAVFALLLSLFLGKRLSSPIVSLTQIADNISRGKFDDKKLDSIATGDEIGALAAAVRRLSASVKLAMEMLAKSS